MTDSTKIQITLSSLNMEKLTQLCTEKGVKRSAIISMAIDKFFREEAGQNDERK